MQRSDSRLRWRIRQKSTPEIGTKLQAIAGKALDGDGHATRFAFVRAGGSDAVSAISLAL
jgi:hypothetical protein